MAAKSDAKNKPCCADPVFIDDGNFHRRCQSCGARWTRTVKDGDFTTWERVPEPVSEPAKD